MTWRHDPRVVSHGLTATIAQVPDAAVTVLDISEGGMLLRADALELAPGAAVDFALEGGGLRGSGTGCVVHCRDGAAGIAVRSWNGLDEAVRHAVETALLASSTWRELYVDPPARPRPPLVAR